MTMSNIIRILSLALPLSGVLAAPSSAAVGGYIIPGDGLPSLESLGLTKEDLFDPDFLVKRGIVPVSPFNSTLQDRDGLGKRAVRYCTTGPPAEVASVSACVNYLNSIGNNACTAPRSRIRMCIAQAPGNIYPAAIYGTAECNNQDSSACRDVASIGQQVIDQCNFFWMNTPRWVAMGGDAARGNGCLQIDVLGA